MYSSSGSKSIGRGFVVAGAIALGLLGGAVAVSATSSAPEVPAQGPPPAELPETVGPEPVGGPDGLAGWVDEADWDRAMVAGPPLRAFGTAGREFQTLEVKDADGALVGYFTLGGPGYVPLATANDPAAMDALIKDIPEPMTQAEAKAAFEEGMNQD